MDKGLESMFTRAKELLRELEEEYNSCLPDRTVTEKIKNLTHEVLEKLRNTLDPTMVKAWKKFIAPNLSEEEQKKALKRVFFPIRDNLDSSTVMS